MHLALLGAVGDQAAGGDTYWAAVLQFNASSVYGTRSADHDLDADGNLVCLTFASGQSKVITCTLDGGDTPSIIAYNDASTGGNFDSYTSFGNGGTVRVRDDGQVSVQWNANGNMRYYKTDSSTGAGLYTWTDAQYYSWTPNYTDYSQGGAYYGPQLDTYDDKDYGIIDSFYAWNNWQRVSGIIHRDTGSANTKTYTGGSNNVMGCSVSLENTHFSVPDIMWLCGVFYSSQGVVLSGLDATGASGQDQKAMKDSTGAHMVKAAMYNARPQASSGAGYGACILASPNTHYGVVVWKASSSSNPISLSWSRTYYTNYAGSDQPQNVCMPVCDSEGNVYVAYRTKLLSIGADPEVYCCIILSWDSSGTFRWARRISLIGTGSEFTYDDRPTLKVTDNDSLTFMTTGKITYSGSDHDAAFICRLPSDGSGYDNGSAYSLSGSYTTTASLWYTEVEAGRGFTEAAYSWQTVTDTETFTYDSSDVMGSIGTSSTVLGPMTQGTPVTIE